MLPNSMSCDAKVGHPVSQEGTREKKWSLNNASYSSSLLSDSHMIICVPGFVECVCCCSICNVQSNQLMCSKISQCASYLANVQSNLANVQSDFSMGSNGK